MILTPEQKEVGRRNFLKASVALPAAGAYVAAQSNFGPVKTGIVGCGNEGRMLMEQLSPAYVNLVAACDIRPDNLKKALTIGPDKYGHELTPYTEYADMLNDTSLEAIVIAAPLSKHAEIAIAAFNAGKHVFCEKVMAKTVDECNAMIEAADKSGKVLQIGHQRFYNPIYWNMYRMVMGGELGDIYHIRCQWHRNFNWVGGLRWWENDEYLKEYPEMKDFDPTRWGYASPDQLCNWRMYRAHSEGLMSELASHMLAITNWLGVDMDPEEVKRMSDDELRVTAVAPSAVIGSGGCYKYKDGEEGTFESKKTSYVREVEDHVFVTFEYPNNRTVFFSSIQTNKYDDYYEMIMGTKGTLILRSEVEAYLFPEPSWEGFKQELEEREKAAAEGNETEVSTKKATGSVGSASASRDADVKGGTVSGSGGAGDYIWQYAYRDELRGFAETIRYGRNNLCDGNVGKYAAMAVIGGNDAIRGKKRVMFNADGTIIS